jgi:hypothetical protein
MELRFFFTLPYGGSQVKLHKTSTITRRTRVVHIVTNGQHQQGNNPRNELRLVKPRPLTPNGVGFPEEKTKKQKIKRIDGGGVVIGR